MEFSFLTKIPNVWKTGFPLLIWSKDETDIFLFLKLFLIIISHIKNKKNRKKSAIGFWKNSLANDVPPWGGGGGDAGPPRNRAPGGGGGGGEGF